MSKSNYKGSASTYKMVASQIKERWGEAEVKKYNPYTNCLTFKQWLEYGYCVKQGEKAIKSVTFVEVKDNAGKVIKSYPKNVNLFYQRQVEKIIA